MTTRPKAGTFCWFELGSTDAPAAAKFYKKWFGWNSKEFPMPGDTGAVYTIFQIGDGDIAGLYALAGSPLEGKPSHWMTYVAVDDADQSNTRAMSLGGKSVMPPMDVPGVGRIAIVQDPTGAMIAMFQAGDHPGAAQLGPEPGTFGWSELSTRDTAAAGAFYSELFGWKLKADKGDMPYTEFQVGGQSIGGMMAMTEHHGDMPPYWLPYVMVKDCDASAAKGAQLGAQTRVPPMDIPDVGRFAVFSDPTGAAIAIVQLTC